MLVHVVLMALFLLSNVYGGKQIFVGDSSAAAGGECWSFNVVDQLYSSLGSEMTILSASPPAIMTSLATTEPFFTQPGANTTYTGPYGMYGAIATDNLVRRASFETCAGGHPTGWVVGGGGDGVLACSTTHKAQGANGISMYTNLITDNVYLLAQCISVDNTKDYSIGGWFYGQSEDNNVTLSIYEFSTINCTLASIDDFSFSVGEAGDGGWYHHRSLIEVADWNVGTGSIQLYVIASFGGGVTTYVDEVEFRQSSLQWDASCSCDTDATCSCSNIIASIDTLATSGDWQFDATIRSPVDGAVATPARQIFHIPETAATNHNRADLYWASDTLTFDVYTTDGTKKTATVALAGNEDTAYQIKAYHSSAGAIAVCAGLPGSMSCGSEVADATQDTPNSTTYIGCTDTVGGNIHIQNACWNPSITAPFGT